MIHQSEPETVTEMEPGDYMVRHVWTGNIGAWRGIKAHEMDLVFLIGFDLDGVPPASRWIIEQCAKDSGAIVRLDRP